jgi:CO/xanthine dehydrogenase Mo-binding subunit
LCRWIDAVNEIAPAHNIGSYVPMVDGPEKVSGRAKYTADFIVPGMLAGRIFRSPYSHAEILEIDVAEAAKLPGVKAIATGADCETAFGVLPVARTEHVLARDRVRYRGEPIAAVAAIDDATAKEALRRIKLKVRELPAYHTAQQAMAPGARIISNATCCSNLAMWKPPLPRPTWSARASTIAPRSARTRWRCTRRSPITMRCAIA